MKNGHKRVDNWQQAKENFALGWYLFRVALAEWFLVTALGVMPDGPEHDHLNKKLYEYYLWTKDNT